MKKLKPFDKYFYYKESVQDPEEDIKFITNVYKSLYKKNPHILREDFCGTFWFGLKWIQGHPKNQAITVDISSEPLNYGKKHHLKDLNPKDLKRIQVLKKSVLHPKLPSAEIITVSNFSYCAIKTRKDLLQYFKNVRKQIKKQGLFTIDVFGGLACQEPNEESFKHSGFTYYWEQENFNPVENQAKFHIHFKRDGEKKRSKVFTYDWRIWSLAELRDLLKEAGFSKVHTYWDVSSDNSKNSRFKKIQRTNEVCETWLAYLISQP